MGLFHSQCLLLPAKDRVEWLLDSWNIELRVRAPRAPPFLRGSSPRWKATEGDTRDELALLLNAGD